MSETPNSESLSSELPNKVLVWDLPVRLIHWGLVLAVFGAWLTRELEGDWFAWHVRCGYAVLVLTATRVLWGFVGTRHARFGAFLRGPAVVFSYARKLLDRDSAPHTGHNPLGAWMIVVMLALLFAQATTGLFANDQIFQTGPLFGYVTGEQSDRLTTLHKQLFDVLWVVIVLHVVAVLFYQLYKRQDLLRPMFSGRKLREAVAPGEEISSSRLVLALLLAALIGAALAWLVATAPEAFLFGF